MRKTHLHIWAEQIAKKTGFILGKEIKRGFYYTPDKIRSLILGGLYKGKPAVLKIYDDPRLSDEPIALKNFNKINKSKIIKVPDIFTYKIISAKKGWLIMEKLPEGSERFNRPIKPEQRRHFVDLYLEYRKNFPIKPTRDLVLSENLFADDFHIFRINRWLQLANDKDAERMLIGQKSVLNPKEFVPRLKKGTELIRKEFKNRKMVWCHGHFNPAEVLKHPEKDIYYLVDFSHTKMYPEGYEIAFIIWSDWIMHADWKMGYKKWKEGIDEWLLEFERAAKKLKIKKFQSLMKASLIERTLGSILADICATNGLVAEKKKWIALLYKFLDDMVK